MIVSRNEIEGAAHQWVISIATEYKRRMYHCVELENPDFILIEEVVILSAAKNLLFFT